MGINPPTEQILGKLLEGFWVNLEIFAVTLALAIPLGFIIAFGSMSKFRPLRCLERTNSKTLKVISKFAPIKLVTRTFVWIIRGTPLMLQLFVVYYGPGLMFRMNFDSPMTAVLLAFVVNYAAYFSEIFRGGIEGVSKGQYEAGYVLGLTKSQIFRKIILKQVIQRIVPPMSNEIITLIKDTALANCIMVCEIIKNAKELAATKAMIWPLFFTGVFYLVFVGILTVVLGKAEKKLSYFRS